MVDFDDEFDNQNIYCSYVNHTIEFDHKKIIVGNADFRILYLNMRSIRNKWYDLEVLVSYIQCSIDVVVLSEIWITEEENKFFNLKEFNSYFSNRSGGYGGTAIFVRLNINVAKIFADDDDFCQAVGIKLTDINTNIIAIYRSQINSVAKFFEMLEKYLMQHCQNIFIGDFNINLLDDQDDIVSRYVQLVNSYGHVFLNKISREHATRSQNGVSTLIDHIFTDLLTNVYNLNTSDTSLSDHKQLFLQISKMTIPRQPGTIFYKVLNYQNIFNDPIWVEILNSKNINEFSVKLKKLICSNMCTIQKKSKVNAPWITPEIENLISEREKFFRLKKKFTDNAYLAGKHKLLSSLVASKIKKAKRESGFAFVRKNIDKPKELWKYFNEVIFNKASNSNRRITSIKIGDQLITNSQEIADQFNNYFVNVLNEISSQFAPPNANDFMYLDYRITHALQLYPTEEIEIKNTVLSLNPNAATGVDNISTKVLQHVINYISPLLATYINHAFTTGIYPDCNKTAKVIPVFKAGDETDLSNYRPISILNAVSKVFEKIMRDRIGRFLELNKLISKHQFGFTSNSNTTAACVNFTNFLSKNIDQGFSCACLFLDLRKAFDTVNPDILMIKLNKLHFTPVQRQLFKSYLSSRMQFVKINDNVSSVNVLNLGVPQGSILGPTLFNLFINDITFIKLQGKIQLYADDCLIMYAAPSLEIVLSQMQCDLQLLKKWFDVNHLTLNHDKTKYMVFENRRPIVDVFEANPITYNSFVIERVTKYTYLGLVIDSKLRWINHVDKIKKTIVPYIFAINRIRHVLPRKSLLLLYFAYIQSRLIYLNPVWSGCVKYKVAELEILQKRVLKYIIKAPVRFPTEQLFKEFDSLHFLIDREILILIHKIITNQIKHNFELTKNQDQHVYNTRRRSHFVIDHFRTGSANNNILYRGLPLYNNLPREIKCITDAKAFRNKIIEYLKCN